MKIKKVRKMSIQKQKKMLANKLKLLKWTKLIRNISLVEAALLSPLYYSVLQDCFSHQSNPSENIETTLLMTFIMGITGFFQGISEKTIADCASLETLIELTKLNRKDILSTHISTEIQEENSTELLDNELSSECEKDSEDLIRARYNM